MVVFTVSDGAPPLEAADACCRVESGWHREFTAATIVGDRTSSASASQLPCWNAETQTLTFAGKVVKRFRQRAENQTLVLASFQELGWPTRIDDPLTGGYCDPRTRLRDTVKKLNRCQTHPLVRFERDGSGEGVIWRPA